MSLHVNKMCLTKKSWKVLFFGTNTESVHSLKALYSQLNPNGLIIRLDVVTLLQSKPNPVHRFSTENNLTVYGWPLTETILSTEFDIGVVVTFGYMIPKHIIEIFPLGMLNVHPSLLPRWRGAAPVYHTILSGDKETGTSIMRIKPHRFDIGEIVKQEKCTIFPNEKTLELSDRLAQIGASLLLECIQELPHCLEAALPQPNENVTYAHKISENLSVVLWTKMSTEEVYNVYRAISNLYPLSTMWHGMPVKLCRITPLATNATSEISISKPPGYVEYHEPGKCLHVWCADAKCIVVEKLSVHKTRKISATVFKDRFLSQVEDSKKYFG